MCVCGIPADTCSQTSSLRVTQVESLKPECTARLKGRGLSEMATGRETQCSLGCWLLSLEQGSRPILEQGWVWPGPRFGPAPSEDMITQATLDTRHPASGPLTDLLLLNLPLLSPSPPQDDWDKTRMQWKGEGSVCLQSSLSWQDRWQAAGTRKGWLHFLP